MGPGTCLTRPLEEVVVNFFKASREQRAWTRLLLWQGLADASVSATSQPDEQPDRFRQAMVDDLRRRQTSGELAANLDPCHILLALFAAASAPIMLPHIARRICGAEPDNDEFANAYADQLARLVRHISRGASSNGSCSRSESSQPTRSSASLALSAVVFECTEMHVVASGLLHPLLQRALF